MQPPPDNIVKITKKQLGKIIKEAAVSNNTADGALGDEFNYIDDFKNNQAMVDEYENWVHDRGHITPSASSVIATYLVNEELDGYPELVELLSNYYNINQQDVAVEIKRQKAEYNIGGVETEEENYARGWYRDDSVTEGRHKIKITENQLRQIIKEEKSKLDEIGFGSMEPFAPDYDTLDPLDDFEPIQLSYTNPQTGEAVSKPLYSNGEADDAFDLMFSIDPNIKYSVDDIREGRPNMKITNERKSKMKVTKRQLRKLIREEIDVLNASTGEIMIFADEVGEDGHTPDAPELAAREIIKRLKLTPLEASSNPLLEPDVEEIWLGAKDYAVMDVEVGGKRHARKNKKERARMDIDNLLAKADQWAADAGGDYGGDNPDVDMQDVAWDLAAGAKYIFKPDEWDELVWHFDNSEDELVTYIADRVAG
jgi:hypothetical protein